MQDKNPSAVINKYMNKRFEIWTPNGYEANKKWHVEDTQLDKVVFTCEYEGDAQKKADDLNKNPAAVALGSLGGKASSKKLSKRQRVERAKKAIQARWSKKNGN